MARKTLSYTVKDSGRDNGKVFVITEMPAARAEKWAMKALLAMMSNGVEVPDNALSAGMAGLANLGLTLIGRLPYEQAEDLLDEMFTCIRLVPNPANVEVTRALVEDDIEEVQTRIKLRLAVFNLHVDFFSAVESSTTASSLAATSQAA